MINIYFNKANILDSLREINFLEQYRYLVKTYKNSFPRPRPFIDKKRVYEIIDKLGFTPGHNGSAYRLKNEIYGNISFEMTFILKSGILDPSLIVYEEGELIYGGPWLKLVCDVVGDIYYQPGKPTFGSYEELEEMLSISLKMYSDFKKVLLAKKGDLIIDN